MHIQIVTRKYTINMKEERRDRMNFSLLNNSDVIDTYHTKINPIQSSDVIDTYTYHTRINSTQIFNFETLYSYLIMAILVVILVFSVIFIYKIIKKRIY